MDDAEQPPRAPERAPAGAPAGVDYSRKWLVLVAIAMAIFLGTIDGSIVNVALPTLADEFGTTFGAVQWVALSYLLTQATLTLSLGRLGDIVGKKPIFVSGFAVFTVGSVLAGLSPAIAWLIAARVVQAVGAAMIFALGFAITTEAFPPSERGRALGINGSMVSLGIIAGPILGGLIIEAIDWRWIFFVNLPIGIIGTITAVKFVPNTRPKGRQRFDFVGAGLFFVALLAFLLALTHTQEAGFSDPLVLIGLVTAFAAGIVFIAFERRVPEPMVDLTLFSDRTLSVSLVSGFVVFVAISGLLLLLPFYLTDVLGFSPRQVGLLLGAVPVTLGLVSPFSGSLSDLIGSRSVTIAGLAILGAGYVLGAFQLGLDTSVAMFLLIGLIIGAGVGVFQSPNNSAILGAVPPSRLGITSGMLTINRITGSITGIAVLGTIWAARTVSYSGGAAAASAPPTAQADALSDTMALTAGLLAATLVLVVWAGGATSRAARSRRSPGP